MFDSQRKYQTRALTRSTEIATVVETRSCAVMPMKFIWVNARLVSEMEGVRFCPFGTNLCSDGGESAPRSVSTAEETDGLYLSCLNLDDSRRYANLGS